MPTARHGIVAAACLILIFQASASRLLYVDERNIGVPGLHELPWQIGKWKASGEQSIGPEVTAYLKPDEYILRDYVSERTPISLFVAYFKSLQNSYGPHSPKICLPGSGWLVTSDKVTRISVPGEAGGIPVNEFTMEKSGSRILVVYWYQNSRNAWAQEFKAKLLLLPDLIRYRTSDVSLVRLILPLNSAASENEFEESVEFTQHLFPLLADHFSSVTARR
jgi:EpsI family protein